MKYLFTATYKDGSVYEQTIEDKSKREPEKRSCFFDVLEKAKEVELVSFVLKGQGIEYGVDLRDGHFEINGVPFFMHEDRTFKSFRLIFFRQHTHSFQVGNDTQKEIEHKIVYRVGWQCTHNGRNYQEVMEID